MKTEDDLPEAGAPVLGHWPDAHYHTDAWAVTWLDENAESGWCDASGCNLDPPRYWRKLPMAPDERLNVRPSRD